jgi:hypothetical protein
MSRPRLILCALPSLLLGCTDHPLVAPDPQPEGETDKYADINITRKVDILFMIDNSFSMEQEQANLARNFPAFIDVLRNVQGGMPDVHLGVITSDLGAGPTNDACPIGGKGGTFQGWNRPCGLDPNSRFIAVSDGEHTRNYQGDLARVFGCMAQVGVQGCGYEHQLASTARALSVAETPDNAGFLRDDAYLQIVLITDEDDCSASPQSDLFTRQFPGEEPSLRCARFGHTCRGQMPPAGDFSVPLADCKPSEDGALTRVQTFIDQIRALKKKPEQILVAGIFGWPNEGASALYQVGRTVSETTHKLSGWDYLPACKSEMNGEATPALRMKQFVDAFGSNGSFASICAGDFRPVLTTIAEKLARLVPGSLCVDAPIVDISPQAGLQADCLISESVPAKGGYDETYLPPCDPELSKTCWRLEDQATCGSGKSVVIERKTPVAPETKVAIKCRTCFRPDDPRCQPRK